MNDNEPLIPSEGGDLLPWLDENDPELARRARAGEVTRGEWRWHSHRAKREAVLMAFHAAVMSERLVELKRRGQQ